MTGQVLTRLRGMTDPALKDLWRTPPNLFERLDKDYGPFDLDAAADPVRTLCEHWLGPDSKLGEDALVVPWVVPGLDRPTRVFCNPPFSGGLVGHFVAWAYQQANSGSCVPTLLVPASTESAWWHSYVHNQLTRSIYPGVTVEFLRRRVQYLRPDGSRSDQNPGFASVVITLTAG